MNQALGFSATTYGLGARIFPVAINAAPHYLPAV
jgi:hypothetical protein